MLMQLKQILTAGFPYRLMMYFLIGKILASPGNAGLAQELGGSIRYVNEKGLEYNQAFAKSLNGAFLADQICNNYLSPLYLMQVIM